MADAWDGVPQNPERDGWHWLRRADGFAAPYLWRAAKSGPRNGCWLYPPDWEVMPEDKLICRQSYLGPCFTPDEVAAREAAAAEAMRDIAAETAREACLVPPDGGSPNADEVEVCDEAERRIRALPIPAPDALSSALAQARAEEREACIAAIEKHAAEIGRQECCGIGQSTGYGPPECCGDPDLMISDREAVRAIRARGKETEA